MDNFWDREEFQKNDILIVQVNLGNRCNLACRHCHIEASPAGDKNMEHETAVKIAEKLKSMPVESLEFTGGEPVLNPELPYLINELSTEKKISVRTNLICLDIPEYQDMIDLLIKNKITIIGSLPSVFEDSTDSQRGTGVFDRTIKVLQDLGRRGAEVDLVYNPTGDYIPEDTTGIEEKYRAILDEKYNIHFNNFISIVNVPIKRYREDLKKKGSLDDYMNGLRGNFNASNVDRVMCRSILTVDYAGYVYDCDFNLAMGNRIKGYEGVKFWEIDFTDFHPGIFFDEYCYACTVNMGSSCHGSLIKTGGIRESVKEYYGEVLQSSGDLKTNACCTTDTLPVYVKESLTYVHDEIVMKYYGCGSPIPLACDGLTALDVGCGTGRDVYILSRLAGEKGFASGIDMTEKQLAVAERHKAEQMKIFGYREPNVSFIHDYMENISAHFPDNSLDLVISNCVMNLVEEKETVMRQIFAALKNGGEFYFSDVYADRRVPEEISRNEILYGECLGGALYYKDFERMARRCGFADPRVMTREKITVNNSGIESLVENIQFYSVTYRLWKLKGLEDACEDYGHVAVYRGGIPWSSFSFRLDDGHIFHKNRPERVCGNTARMLSETRFSRYFDVIGNFSEHFGAFAGCGTLTVDSPDESGTGDGGGPCC